MSEQPLSEGGRYALKHTTRTARATVDDLRYRIDVNTLHRDRDAAELGLNDIGRVTLRLSKPIAFDTYTRNRSTGSFVLIDEATDDTVAAGMIVGARGSSRGGLERRVERSPNVTWHPGGLSREERWQQLGQRGAVVWMTGLPGSGKSTIANGVEQQLVAAGQPAYVLDGDNLRHGLNGNLGFSPEDRSENVRRTAHVAALLADAGAVVLASLVSPYAEDRAIARRIVEEQGLEFVEVFVNTPLDECERRDPKGLYAKARAGEISGFTGVDAPYEAPERAEVEIRSAETGVEEAIAAVLDRLGD
jgi:bifunctional enzyme CysN/CysC